MTESEEQGAVSHLVQSRIARFWLRELPYIIVLALTILGVAYTSVSHRPLIGYWQFLAVAIGLVCVATGWLHIHDPKARFRMIWTQALHWLAFLVAMNIVLLANVQLTLTATATGLTLLMLLALGTFVAGASTRHTCRRRAGHRIPVDIRAYGRGSGLVELKIRRRLPDERKTTNAL